MIKNRVKPFTRTLSFFSKWVAEIVRQPTLMITLVLGPFLILLLFGQGQRIGATKPSVTLVTPPESAQHSDLNPVPQELSQYLVVKEVTSDLGKARADLADGRVDLVAVLPDDPLGKVQQGQRAPVQIFTNEIDPVRQQYAQAYLSDQISLLNQRTVQKAISDAQGSADEIDRTVDQALQYLQNVREAQRSSDLPRARQQTRQLKAIVDPLAATSDRVTLFTLPGQAQDQDPARRLTQAIGDVKRDVDSTDARLASANDASGLPSPAELDRIERNLRTIKETTNQIKAIPAEVLSAPFELQLTNVAPFVPSFTAFFAPAVLALLLQHLAITLGALSMARMRLLGLMELLKTAPVRASEVVVGNYISYGTLCAIAGALLSVLLIFALGVPLFGQVAAFVAILLFLILSSLGLGFVIAMVSTNEQQAAQLAMLILIASVFFSGFIVSIQDIIWPIRAVSYLLPTTYAIRTLQDVMLRGALRTPEDLTILFVASAVLFGLAVYLFRREFKPR